MKTIITAQNLDKNSVIHNALLELPINWLEQGINNFIKCPILDIFYGIAFTILCYISYIIVVNSHLVDIVFPLLAIIILISGPIFAMSLYDLSKRLDKREKNIVLFTVIKSAFNKKSSCQSIAISLVLLLLTATWIILTPLIFAIFKRTSLVMVAERQPYNT